MKLQPVNLNFNYYVAKTNNKEISPVSNNISELNKNIDYRNYPLSFKGLLDMTTSPMDFVGIGKNDINYENFKKYLDCHIGGNFSGVTTHWCNPARDFASFNIYRFASDLEYIIRINLHDKKMTLEEVIDILDKYSNISEEKINKKIINTIGKHNNPFNTKEIIARRQKFIKNLAKYMSENKDELKKQNYIDLSDIQREIIKKIYKNEENKFREYNELIRKKLEYDHGESNPKTIDIEEEIAKLPQELQDDIHEKYGNNYDKMMHQYIAHRAFDCFISGYEYGNSVEEALLQMLPRYEVKKSKADSPDACFEYEPLYRWLNIENVDEFLKQFKPGSVYSYNRSQSCAKSSRGAESWYGDSQEHQNVKFRIHPKSQLTQSYDIKDIECNRETGYKYGDDMWPVYRDGETIYPANQKFKVLGYARQLAIYPENHVSAVSEKDKIVIDLQEI